MVCSRNLYNIFVYKNDDQDKWIIDIHQIFRFFETTVPSIHPNGRTHILFSRQFDLLGPSLKGRPWRRSLVMPIPKSIGFFHSKYSKSTFPVREHRWWVLWMLFILSVFWKSQTRCGPSNFLGPQVANREVKRGGEVVFVRLQLHPKTLGRSRSVSTHLAMMCERARRNWSRRSTSVALYEDSKTLRSL